MRNPRDWHVAADFQIIAKRTKHCRCLLKDHFLAKKYILLSSEVFPNLIDY